MKWNLKEVKKIEYHVKNASKRCQHPTLQDLVVKGLYEDERSTPLLMACQHGDLKAVKRIVERWRVNVSISAVHYANWPCSRLEGVTPLFVAAYYCHINIVRYLIEKGADVHSRTHSTDQEYSGLTPLHAVTVFSEDTVDEKISTIRCLLEAGADPSPLSDDGMPIWHYIFSSSQITTFLVEWGMDLNQREPYSGNTVLHFWAKQVTENPDEDESLGAVQMLLEKGANSQDHDYYGFSVILAAANGDGELPNLIVLDYLLDRDDIPRQDKIDALEFAGAVILAHNENHEKFPLAFQLWRRAVTLRLMDTEDCHPFYKTPLKSKSGQLSEWTTLDDIEQIEQNPAQREIQSLLVRLRICAGLSQRALSRRNMVYYMYSVFQYLLKGVDHNRTFNQMMDITLTAIEGIFRCDPIGSNLISSTINVISKLIFIFRSFSNDDPNFNSATLKVFVELVAKMDQLYLPDANLKIVADTNHINNLKNLVSILSRRPELFTEEMKLNLVRMVRRDVRDSSGWNVLLTACRISPGADTLSTVRLLLELKVDANAVTNVGDGPLHLLAMVLVNTETRDAIARLLLTSDAHLDMVNKEGMTPADLWLKKSKENGDWRDLPDWLQEGVANLKCLCSRVIRRHRLPYNDGAIVPVVLIPFVSLH